MQGPSASTPDGWRSGPSPAAAPSSASRCASRRRTCARWWRTTPPSTFPPLVPVLFACLPDVGHGFIKDDFAWIRASRISGARDVLALFGKDNGFYRPLVSLTFAFDHRLFGLHPFAFGLTNLVLLLA